MVEIRQKLRGSTAALNAYVGSEGQLLVDLGELDLRVYDGVTAGGFRIPNFAFNEATYFKLTGGNATGFIGAHSGRISLENDDAGGGDSAVAFNHRNGSATQDGSSTRIISEIDETTANMKFMFGNNAVATNPTAMTEGLELTATYAQFAGYATFGGYGEFTDYVRTPRLETRADFQPIVQFTNPTLGTDLKNFRLTIDSLAFRAYPVNDALASGTGSFVLDRVADEIRDGRLELAATNLSTFPSGASIATRTRADARYLQLTGGTLTGDLQVNNLTVRDTIGRQYWVSNGNAVNQRRWSAFNGSYFTIRPVNDDNSSQTGEIGLYRDATGLTDGRLSVTGADANNLPASTSIVNRNRGDARYLQLTGGVMTGQLDIRHNGVAANPALRITNSTNTLATGLYAIASGSDSVLRITIDNLPAADFYENDDAAPSTLAVMTRAKGDARYMQLNPSGNALGSYLFAGDSGVFASGLNTVVNGSVLRASNANGNQGGGAFSGTWRLLGHLADGAGYEPQRTSLWVRIT